MQNKMKSLKEKIIYTLNTDVKNLHDLVSVCKWALKQAELEEKDYLESLKTLDYPINEFDLLANN